MKTSWAEVKASAGCGRLWRCASPQPELPRVPCTKALDRRDGERMAASKGGSQRRIAGLQGGAGSREAPRLKH